jgi:hypothetical protein
MRSSPVLSISVPSRNASAIRERPADVGGREGASTVCALSDFSDGSGFFGLSLFGGLA